MGYRPNQTPPAAPTPPTADPAGSRVVYGVVLVLSLVWSLGILTGLMPQDAGVIMMSTVACLTAWQAGRRTVASELPDPKVVARELMRAKVRAELTEDRDRAAWIARTVALEMENGIAVDPAYEEEVAAIEARTEARSVLLEKMAEDEKAEAAAKPGVPRPAPYPPRPPAGRGAASLPPDVLPDDVKSIFGYPVDLQAGVVVVGGNDRGRVQRWLDQRGYPLRAVREHNLFTGRAGPACAYCGLGPHRYEGTHSYDDGASRIAPLAFADPALLSGDERTALERELLGRLTSAEPVRILQGGMVVRHICTTVDCNGVDAPHCQMSKPCVCGKPSRGWPNCPQHPGLSPL